MTTAEQGGTPKVQLIDITEEQCDQRLDNFLITFLKGVPKSHIYRIVRKGEVRVNKGRVDVKYRLETGDQVRIPPVRVAEKAPETFVGQHLQDALAASVLFEDEAFMIINKPAGYAVHGGTGINSGIIEGLRSVRPNAPFLELVHRLDKDTSGCLLIAKKRSALKKLHTLFREDQVQKTYLALLAGQWLRKKLLVSAPLQKNQTQGGERMVFISKTGKEAETLFRRLKLFPDCTLVEAAPKTGRTHQIRVHAASSLGHPIVGDERYGQDDVNKAFRSRGYKRMFLHAATLQFTHPVTGALLTVSAPLPQQLDDLLTYEERL
ncbi:23S rRNA pseudouridine(955/2504/2580) synthase RluC [Methylovulum psychrotolerans]|jgi:23S rRNA pseudouridine955/2504/2580 synthase|uniref:Pseudouridine synthase n=1 Tax=Methylovulum psychrotolerans TaxID=1704499 RepID=A0A1Z4BZ80_9GAMM|nr:23S rRNA pseudouridine(955/2504/2580) synthase RluC [Methylovulum psychrotolerans]ASF46562.1 23S rRNA pseudouridine(955/2504/2580) synthase [Methylovulum psychrotolerans]MBT9097892.1 23S rRNA pseudouridine(955/2504/2580) synthase RluC [Methylovulum psychrotolerans]POZ53597.1 23S rRNA pseudouridine(955/2504/2580) synthase RluC [Methylovulum psychrotolerans]